MTFKGFHGVCGFFCRTPDFDACKLTSTQLKDGSEGLDLKKTDVRL